MSKIRLDVSLDWDNKVDSLISSVESDLNFEPDDFNFKIPLLTIDDNKTSVDYKKSDDFPFFHHHTSNSDMSESETQVTAEVPRSISFPSTAQAHGWLKVYKSEELLVKSKNRLHSQLRKMLKFEKTFIVGEHSGFDIICRDGKLITIPNKKRQTDSKGPRKQPSQRTITRCQSHESLTEDSEMKMQRSLANFQTLTLAHAVESKGKVLKRKQLGWFFQDRRDQSWDKNASLSPRSDLSLELPFISRIPSYASSVHMNSPTNSMKYPSFDAAISDAPSIRSIDLADLVNSGESNKAVRREAETDRLTTEAEDEPRAEL